MAVGAIHLLPAALLPLLRYNSWLIPALLVLVLAVSLLVQVRTIRRAARWRLAWREAEGWLVLDEYRERESVHCRFEFLSARLVVVGLSCQRRPKYRRLVLTPGSCSADEWRRLHILARAADARSGVADDNVLGGKVDRHQNRIPGNL